MPDKPDGADLPGLEPDEPPSVDSTPPEQPDPPPRGESPASASSPSPRRWGEGKWTSEELDHWWHNEGGEARYEAARSDLSFGQGWGKKTEFGKTVDWIDEEYEAIEETDLDDHLPEDQRSDEARLSEAFLSGEATFSRLRPNAKAAIRDDLDALDLKARASGPSKSEAGWDSPADLVYVTLPDGSEAAIEVDKEAGRQRVVDRDGNAGEWQSIEKATEPEPAKPKPAPSTEPSSKSSSGLIGGLPRGMVFGGGGIFAMAMVGLVFVFSGGGGGGASGPWSVSDPQNDFVPAFSDKDAIANPSAAGDVTGLDVAIADGNTTVTVTFAGAAEGLMTEGGEELAAALQFIPIGDERWIDILFDEDGSVKISDPPSGSRITATWSSSNTLVFEILGVTPASGATVRFATIQRSGFAHSTDEVSLAAGDSDAVVATAFVPSGDSSGGVPDAPVIVSACDTIDGELVSEAFGPSEITSRGGDKERTSNCTYESASGIRLDLSVQRRSNPRSDAFGAFRDSYEAASETRSIDWGVEGELRVLEERDSSAAALLVYVHSGDPVGREIYVRIDATGAPGQGATLAAAIEPFGERLRDAVLEAQP